MLQNGPFKKIHPKHHHKIHVSRIFSKTKKKVLTQVFPNAFFSSLTSTAPLHKTCSFLPKLRPKYLSSKANVFSLHVWTTIPLVWCSLMRSSLREVLGIHNLLPLNKNPLSIWQTPLEVFSNNSSTHFENPHLTHTCLWYPQSWWFLLWTRRLYTPSYSRHLQWLLVKSIIEQKMDSAKIELTSVHFIKVLLRIKELQGLFVTIPKKLFMNQVMLPMLESHRTPTHKWTIFQWHHLTSHLNILLVFPLTSTLYL